MNILLTGGGTMGPVTPLLAIVEAWRKKTPNVEFLWVGTPSGPERELVERYQIPYVSIPVARIPRYVSIEWLTFPFMFVAASVRASRIVRSFRPDLIASAGGYTSVPVVLAGWFSKIPSWLHQQDVEPIMTSRVLAPFVGLITIAFQQTLSAFPSAKTKLVGNPVRASLFDGSKEQAIKTFQLDASKPSVLVFGGGRGAAWLNQMIETILPQLLQTANVIHVTGKGKSIEQHQQLGYYQAPFLSDDMKHAYAAADVVVSRAGMGAITELAALSMASILIPLPNSPQEKNVKALHGSVEVVTQDQEPTALLRIIEQLLANAPKRSLLADAMHNAVRTDHVADELVTLLETLVKNKHTP